MGVQNIAHVNTNSHVLSLYSSRKNQYPPHGRSSEIPRGRGGGGWVLKVKILEAKYKAKLEFPRVGWEGGAKKKKKKKTFRGGGVWIFSGAGH